MVKSTFYMVKSTFYMVKFLLFIWSSRLFILSNSLFIWSRRLFIYMVSYTYANMYTINAITLELNFFAGMNIKLFTTLTKKSLLVFIYVSFIFISAKFFYEHQRQNFP